MIKFFIALFLGFSSVTIPCAFASENLDAYRFTKPPPPPKPTHTKFVCGFRRGYTQHPMKFRFTFGDGTAAEAYFSISSFPRAYANNEVLTLSEHATWKDGKGNIYTLDDVGDGHFYLAIRYPSNMTGTIYICTEVTFWNF